MMRNVSELRAQTRNAQPGDRVETCFSGPVTVHTITKRYEGVQSQSRIMFEVTPPVPKSNGGPIDADWFSLTLRTRAP
jgi:hypothetical protein